MARVLLVEDDALISRMIKLRLSLRNHEVEHAANGQLGVEKALEQPFDIILMDMHMPVMDGHEATKILREKGYTGLIVAVTASVMSEDNSKALKSGCDVYIAKPIAADFEDQIEALIKDAQD